MKSKKGFSSISVHGVGERDKMGSVVTPIYQTSTFFFESAEDGAKCFSGESNGFIYTRLGNPTIDEFEATIAALEHGYNGIATSSGMAAVNTVYLTFLGQGDHVVCHNALYGPSRGILETAYPKFGVESTFVDTAKLKNVEEAIRPNTRLIFLETPANPIMGICDIEAISRLAHQHGINVCTELHDDQLRLQHGSAPGIPGPPGGKDPGNPNRPCPGECY